jgi:hypothetical protein
MKTPNHHTNIKKLFGLALLIASWLVQAQALKDLTAAFKTPNTALVKSTAIRQDNSYGRLLLLKYDPKTKAVLTQSDVDLNCLRTHTNGVEIFCLGLPMAQQNSPFPQYAFYDSALKKISSGNLIAGNFVSRARLSKDGKYASSTAFKSGAGYGASGLSTEALIIDPKGRSASISVENFQLTHDTKIIKPTDLNIWGLTFDPKQSSLFYATASFGGVPYLVKGDVLAKTLITLAANIECPSLSPDGKWIAYKSLKAKTTEKSLAPSFAAWVPAIMNLATNERIVFDEPSGVDDQIEWLDSKTLVYEQKAIVQQSGLTFNLVIRDITQPSYPSKLWMANAASPTFIRR